MTRRCRSVSVVAGWCAAAAVLAPAVAGLMARTPDAAVIAGQPAEAPRLMLGVLRNDAIVLPFAAFDGKRWSTPWPGSLDDFGGASRELPVSLASVPRSWWGGREPGPWKVWPTATATPRPLTLLSPAMARVGMIRQLGFRTDHPPVLPPVPPSELPFPKVGLAVAGEVDVEPISQVSRLAGTWRTFNDSLRADFDKAEEQALRAIRLRSDWVHPVKREARLQIPTELEAWYVSPLPESGAQLSYIEAVKKYPLTPEDDGCGLETFVSGWVHRGDAAKPETALKAVVGYCDRRAVSYMLPLGRMTLGRRVHWVFQMSGRDHEWYAVIENNQRRIKYVAQYQAGRAPTER